MLKRMAFAGLLVLPGLAVAQSDGLVLPDQPVNLPTLNITGTAPLLGSGGDPNKVPAASNIIPGKTVVRLGIPSALGALNDTIGGVSLDDAAGNPYQPNFVYRGFTASPLAGTAQGIAVYLNGTRFNQPFADSVDFDLIPDEAIARMNLEGANPVFGLNALGGALSVQLKDGFTFHGGDASLYGGSFGQIGTSFEYGAQHGNTAAYIAGTIQHDNGWRQDQGSEIRRVYGDLGWRGEAARLDLALLAADNHLSGPGTTPVQLLAADRSAQFTAPNLTVNKYVRLSLTGSYDLDAATSLQGAAYYLNLSQRVLNGNSSDTQPCGDGLLCDGGGNPLLTRGGAAIADFLAGGPYAQLDRQGVDTNGYGASAQITHSGSILGHANRLVTGLSLDGGVTGFNANTATGALSPDRYFTGPGLTIAQPDLSIAPVRVSITNNYYGAYASDTLDLTKRLALTLSGRLNVAQIDLHDRLGTALSGNHSYTHFNPGAGLTYKITPDLTAYASYSVANRAPTPAELSCADSTSPCTLSNFFVSDPGLKQVVAHTIEAGLRGVLHPLPGADMTWHAGLFRTDSGDDIRFVASAIPGRDYFQNVGTTRRQGIEAGATFRAGRLNAWIDYAYTDATFQTPLTLDSPLNPGADASGQIHVRAGDHLPGVPAHRLKFGATYGITPAWTLGLSGIASSGQYLFGDEANLTPKTGSYVVLTLNTSYQLTPRIQLFGFVRNLLDARYETYGAFSPTASVPIAIAPGASDPRSLSPAPPIAGFGGIRVIL